MRLLRSRGRPARPRGRRSAAEQRRSFFAVGLVTLAVVSALTYLGFAKRVPWADDWEIRAAVPTTNGLREGSKVRVAGVEVGRVTRLERGPGSTGVVTLAIEEEGRPLRRDATLTIRPRLFLEGNFFVDLSPGSPSAPELEEDATLPLSAATIPVQFDQVLTTLTAPVRRGTSRTLRELADALEGGGAEAFRAGLEPAADAFRGTAVVSEAFRGEAPDDLSTLVGRGADVSEALARSDRRLGDLVGALDTTLTALADRETELGATLRGLAGTLDASPPALDVVDRALPTLRAVARELRPALREAPGTLDLADPLLAELEGLLGPDEAPALVADLRPTLRTLSAIQPRLVDLFDLVRPVSDCVRTRAEPVLRAELDDGHLSSDRPVWQDLLHGMVGLASASQNFDANGPAVRYYAGANEETVSSGEVPGVGRLFGSAPAPLLGSRPARPAEAPPFRPDQPCLGQEPVDLEARTTEPPASTGRRARRLPRAERERLLRRLRRQDRRARR